MEKVPGNKLEFFAKLPWEELEEIVLKRKQSKQNGNDFEKTKNPKNDLPKSFGEFLSEDWKQLDSASIRLWKDYGLFEKVDMLFSDTLIGDDGDLTESRDYNTYVREMDEIA